LSFTLSYRDVEELLSIRGIKLAPATIQRWAFKFSPLFGREFRGRKKRLGMSWRMDETYIKVGGKNRCLYIATMNLQI